MKIYIMLPFVQIRSHDKSTEFSAALTEDYAEQFDDRIYAYPSTSEVMRKTTHYTGTANWAYTIMLPQTFRIYEGGK